MEKQMAPRICMCMAHMAKLQVEVRRRPWKNKWCHVYAWQRGEATEVQKGAAAPTLVRNQAHERRYCPSAQRRLCGCSFSYSKYQGQRKEEGKSAICSFWFLEQSSCSNEEYDGGRRETLQFILSTSFMVEHRFCLDGYYDHFHGTLYRQYLNGMTYPKKQT